MTVGIEKSRLNPELSLNAKKLLNVEEGDLLLILKENNVTTQELEEKMIAIKEWYGKQAHLPEQKLCDQLLVRHLILKQFSVERVKDAIDNYYSAKNRMPDLLTGRDPLCPTFDHYFDMGYWIVLPERTPQNERVTIFRVKTPGEMTVAGAIKMIFMIGDYRLLNDVNTGEHWIFDFTNTSFQQSLQFSPVLVSKIIFYLKSCLNPKLKGVHLINLPSYAETILNVFKKTLKAKIVQRIHTYSSMTDVVKKFPRSMFPKELGGDLSLSCQDITDAWSKTLRSPAWREYFIQQDSLKTDESKRANPSKLDDVFGVEGSFRKLDID